MLRTRRAIRYITHVATLWRRGWFRFYPSRAALRAALGAKCKNIIKLKRVVIICKYYICKKYPFLSLDKIVEYQAPFGLDLESKGTLALLAIAIPLLQVLEIGGFIAVDEMEQNIHPKLHQLLIGLFNTNQNNPNNAQMVFTTHDVTMINRDFFRFDQIVFAEKNNKGESLIYRLSDFNGISKAEALEKWYLLGRFGAIPIIAEKENIYLHFPKSKPNA